MTRKLDGVFGVGERGGGGRGSNRKYKGRKEGGQLEEATPPSYSFKEGLSLSLGLQGHNRRAGGPRRRQLHAGPGCMHGTGCQLEGKRARLATEGRGLVLFSFLCRVGENRVVNLARPNFLPQGKFFPVLGKHTWLEFSSPSQWMVPGENKTFG